jgi:hypothetical protein
MGPPATGSVSVSPGVGDAGAGEASVSSAAITVECGPGPTPFAHIVPPAPNFGSVAVSQSSTIQFTLTDTDPSNSFTVDSSVEVIDGTDAPNFTIDTAADAGSSTTCANGVVLQPGGGSCVISVKFAPLSPGHKQAQWPIDGLHSVTLVGTGT